MYDFVLCIYSSESLEGSTESDTTEALPEEPEEEPVQFPDVTPLLDSRLQKSRVDLAHRRSRVRTPHSIGLTSRGCDSTDGSLPVMDSDAKEPQSKQQRPLAVSLFPGVSPATLIAHIKKRSSEPERPPEEHESTAHGPEQGAEPEERSPRPAPHMAGATMVLPPVGSSGSGSSPLWLKELKSKKRMGLDTNS
ncbi:uncharacterized protein KIAA1671-like [Eucyclogobius newberryi]|uniref:uncharacterized protein KIAA1671-like n=1 Tax=Eucyclogobius newberryi TaxID=166745 RepID=UPI003B5A0107